MTAPGEKLLFVCPVCGHVKDTADISTGWRVADRRVCHAREAHGAIGHRACGMRRIIVRAVAEVEASGQQLLT